MRITVRATVLFTCVATCSQVGLAQPPSPIRARDLGIPFTGATGPNNAITDVPGVEVG